MPGKRLDVRAASSAVPWRNAQPTSPSTAPSKAENKAAPAQISVNNTSPTTTQQPKIKDLVGYTAVLSIKAVKNQEDRVLGIVKEVIGASETGLGHPLLKVVSQTTTNFFTGNTTLASASALASTHKNKNTPETTTTTKASSTSTPPVIFEVEHLIPLVRSIVPRIDPGSKRLLVDPPSGLLDLGRRRALLQHLKIELKQFITRKTNNTSSKTQDSGVNQEALTTTELENISDNKKTSSDGGGVGGGITAIHDENNNNSSSSISSSSISSSRGTESGSHLQLNMPLRRELESAGRKDLIKLIQSAGGFIEVAQDLGFKPIRRPPGYWEDEEALDRELSLFVAANWVRFEEDSDTEELESAIFSDPQQRIALENEEEEEEEEYSEEEEEENDEMSTTFSQFQETKKEKVVNLEKGNEVYWYNQVTRKVRWSAPVLPQTLALDDQGSTLLTESPEDRAMPSRSALFAAGRYDLHQAIVAAGGYGQVSEDLDRYPAWPPSRHLRSIRTLAAELKEVIEDSGLPRQRMPTRGDLLSMGRSDLHQAVTKLGGYPAVAKKLRWKSQRKKRGEWKNIEEAAVQVRKFAEEHVLGKEIKSASSDDDSNRSVVVLRMPTHEELRTAGRHDLRHALQRHGSAEVARVAGLEVTRRTGFGSGKSRQQKLEDMVASAAASGAGKEGIVGSNEEGEEGLEN